MLLKRAEIWRGAYRIADGTAAVLTLVGGLFAVSVKTDANALGAFKSAVEWAQNRAVAGPILLVLALVMQFIRGRLGTPRKWELVRDLLERFRELVFEAQPDAGVHHHRATLFKYRAAFPFARDGILVPVERTGYATRRTKARFKAPDDADRAEGIAGQTWARNGVLLVTELPAITESSTAADIDAYARSTYVAREWVKKRIAEGGSFPRCLCGIPVEVGNKPWGVIVLDSRAERSIDEKALNTYHLIARYLGKLLEKGKT